MKVSAVVITLNEEKSIGECLATLSWADEVMVLDGGSTDRTVEFALAAGARVEFRPFDNYSRQKNAALALARGEWQMLVDTDERVPVELAAEISQAFARREIAGFWVPRKNYIFGIWIRHAGWYPDYQMRLTKKGRAAYDERHQVHETVIVEGETDYLQTPLVHYNYDSLEQFHKKQARYTEMAAQDLLLDGVRAKPWSPLVQAGREFWRRYVDLEGWQDGRYGLLLSLLISYYEGVKYKRLRQLARAMLGNKLW